MRGKHENRKGGCGCGCLGTVVILVAAVVLCSWFFNTYRNGSALTDADVPLVKTARAELGNKGGEKFWSWYGFDYQVDWCGCFVSWCADQNGYLDDDRVPKFCYVQEGLNWFKEEKKWKKPGYKPGGGEVIFFDWNDNDIADHVGIVSGTMMGRVLTIEGNAKGSICARKSYRVDSKYIMGYGIP